MLPLRRNERYWFLRAKKLKISFRMRSLTLARKLSDGTGGQESDEPTLGIMTTTLLAALVNAVKELHAEIETLKGRSPCQSYL